MTLRRQDTILSTTTEPHPAPSPSESSELQVSVSSALSEPAPSVLETTLDKERGNEAERNAVWVYFKAQASDTHTKKE